MNFSTNPCVEAFDDLLDCEGDVVIGNLTYSRSQVLQAVDPIAYRISVNEYIDSQIEDLRYDLDRVDPDDTDEVEDLEARIEELESYYI